MTTHAGSLWWLLATALVFGEANTAEPEKIQGQPAVAKSPGVSGQFQYVAETLDVVRRAGPVTAAGITWHCKDRSCTVTGPWPVPGIAACQALAAAVGPLRSYGHSSRYLAPAELEQCNHGQQSSAPKPSTPAMLPSKIGTPAPVAAVVPGPAVAAAPSTGAAPVPPSSGVAGTDKAPSPGAWPGEPGAPTPIPGSRGPGEDPDAIRDAIQRLRDEMASCRPEDRPMVRLTSSLRPEETLATDHVTLTWSVSRSDGGAWTSRVFLGRADDPVAAYSEVSNSGAWSLDGADLSPTRTVQWVIYTRCGESRVYVGRIPSPRISAIPGVLNCDRYIPTVPAEDPAHPRHPCPALNIQGSGFGSDSMPLRRVQLVDGDRVIDDLEIQSWTTREIILRAPPDLPRGSYSVVVSRGFSEDRFETARSSSTALVRWRDILPKVAFGPMLQGILVTSEMVLDTMGERECGPIWSARALYPPYGTPLTLDELRAQMALCSATPDPVACVRVTACSIYEEDGSYLSLALPDGARRTALSIPIRSIGVPLLGTGRYFVDDLRTLPRGMSASFAPGSDAQLNLALRFESDGRELRGFGDSAGGNDDLWPDGDMNDAVFVLPTHVRVSDGTLTIVADAAGVQFSADIDLGGVCDGPADVCDLLGAYKETIRASVAATVPGQFNAEDTQREIREALRGQLCIQGVGAISALESDTTVLFLYPTDVVGCPAT